MYHKVFVIYLSLCLTVSFIRYTKADTTPPTPLLTKFSYSCDVNGTLTIKQADLKHFEMKLLDNVVGTCEMKNITGNYIIEGCGKNKKINVLLETTHNGSIIGGNRIREFQLYCEDSTKPYVVSVTLSGLNVNEATDYITLPSVAAPKSANLIMEIYESGSNNILTTAVIGQEMDLKITSEDNYTVDPVKCYAISGKNRYMFWSKDKCEADPTLVGHVWNNVTGYSVSITLYAFHFETSHKIEIMCSVRVCPSGYKGNQCDLKCGGSTRKRRAAFSNKITTVRTKIHVVDTESVTDSGNGLVANVLFVLLPVIFANMQL